MTELELSGSHFSIHYLGVPVLNSDWKSQLSSIEWYLLADRTHPQIGSTRYLQNNNVNDQDKTR